MNFTIVFVTTIGLTNRKDDDIIGFIDKINLHGDIKENMKLIRQLEFKSHKLDYTEKYNLELKNNLNSYRKSFNDYKVKIDLIFLDLF